MYLYCLDDFKVEFDRLNSKKSYKALEQDLIDYFLGKTSQDLRSGTRLNNSDDTPYIKKRLKGRGGFRCYYLLIIKNDSLYLMFVHPKTGSMGAENIIDESKAYLYKKVLESIKSEDLYRLTLSESNKKIIFEKIVNVSN